jgi:hypothetical protein
MMMMLMRRRRRTGARRRKPRDRLCCNSLKSEEIIAQRWSELCPPNQFRQVLIYQQLLLIET